ncbi:permease [Faecalispora anaeroviscerum]|uniref:permease n=1 Tax=Faecalispora anaeroviscerum TaxID=2991836 RepID=UPI0024B8F538|nr:permease [Faecalispora anaeroviscerum]
MAIPVYVVTGFLESGKTTLLNHLFRQESQKHRLIVQFESGIEEISNETGCDVMIVPKRVLEDSPEKSAVSISNYVTESALEEIWVEWNGVTPLEELYALFSRPELSGCRLEKIIHMADAQTLSHLLGRTGSALPGQIAACDFAVLRGAYTDAEFRGARRLLREINPGLRVMGDDALDEIMTRAIRRKTNPPAVFATSILAFATLYLGAEALFHLSQTRVNTVINIFLGIMLQAIPFLLIGVLISSAIQVLIPQRAIERLFPKNLAGGMLVAILAGFCLPVCDCASIPIFRSLVRKGIPLPVAVTFMTATPVINPVVMLSTYTAFNGNLSVMLGRVGMGILSAVLIGCWFALRPGKLPALSAGYDRIMCSCGCYGGATDVSTLGEKLSLLLRHSQAEFFSVAKYLTVGAFLAAVFQVMVTNSLLLQTPADFALSLLLMMVLAFLLSLCSSSDAVVAKSFAARFPMAPVMGFLVFGPMMDLKNVLMLSGGFSRRFVAKLFLVCFTVCFVVVYTTARLFVGG